MVSNFRVHLLGYVAFGTRCQISLDQHNNELFEELKNFIYDIFQNTFYVTSSTTLKIKNKCQVIQVMLGYGTREWCYPCKMLEVMWKNAKWEFAMKVVTKLRFDGKDNEKE